MIFATLSCGNSENTKTRFDGNCFEDVQLQRFPDEMSIFRYF